MDAGETVKLWKLNAQLWVCKHFSGQRVRAVIIFVTTSPQNQTERQTFSATTVLNKAREDPHV